MDTKRQIRATTKNAPEDGTIEMVVMSDDTVDRYNDTVDPRGWDINSFMQNPVLLWAHDAGFGSHSIPAIGTVSNVKVNGKNQLTGKLHFDMDDEFAVKVYNKYKKGVLKAVSVGFLGKEWEERDDGGVDFKKQELLELSAVNVPANPAALTTLRSMQSDESEEQAKLMEEYLQKHAGSKKKQQSDEEPEQEEKQIEDTQEPDPRAERLDKIANELQNAVNSLRTLVEQFEKSMKAPETKQQPEPSTTALDEMADYARVLDKGIEIFLKRHKLSKKKGGGD